MTTKGRKREKVKHTGRGEKKNINKKVITVLPYKKKSSETPKRRNPSCTLLWRAPKDFVCLMKDQSIHTNDNKNLIMDSNHVGLSVLYIRRLLETWTDLRCDEWEGYILSLETFPSSIAAPEGTAPGWTVKLQGLKRSVVSAWEITRGSAPWQQGSLVACGQMDTLLSPSVTSHRFLRRFFSDLYPSVRVPSCVAGDWLGGWLLNVEHG